MSAYPIVYKSSDGKICFRASDNSILYKDGTFTIDERGINPRTMLQWSDDGGFTWSNEYWVNVGRVGQFYKKVNWHRLGSSSDRVFRVTVTSPVKWIFVGASIEVTKGK